jgi:hypothetical protein
LRETFPDAGPYRYVILESDIEADERPGALAKGDLGTLDRKLPPRDARPYHCAERATSSPADPRLRELLPPGPHPRLSGKRYAESSPRRAQAVTKLGCDFKRPSGGTPSSVFLARSGVGSSSHPPICHRRHEGSKQYSPSTDPSGETPAPKIQGRRRLRTVSDGRGRPTRQLVGSVFDHWPQWLVALRLVGRPSARQFWF